MADAPRDLVRKLSAGEPLLACAEALTAREAAAEDLMLALRMTRGASPDLLRRAVADGVSAPALVRACEDACARGLAERTLDGGLAPTHRGWLLGNELYGLMWDLAGDD
jgi:oxygen-independent coproporphyrinogen-3 oxidase